MDIGMLDIDSTMILFMYFVLFELDVLRFKDNRRMLEEIVCVGL